MSKIEDKPKKTTRKKRQLKKVEALTQHKKPHMYVMYGFKKSDIDKTAFLQLRTDGSRGKHGMYKVVRDEAEATRFPGEPLDEASAKGFGTPKQWAKFFNEEDELSGWSFHPIGVRQ